MIIGLTTIARHKGWRYKFADGEKVLVNFANVAEAREVDIEVFTYPSGPEDPGSGDPEITTVRALAIMFNVVSANGDALIFHYRETLKEVAKKLDKANTTYSEFVYV